MAAMVAFSGTVGTGIVTGGVLTYVLITPQAAADFTWNGNEGKFGADAWAVQSNWLLDGATWKGDGPGTVGSKMWSPIYLSGGGTRDSLQIGSDSDRVEFEGFGTRFDVNQGATLYGNFKKFQESDSEEQWIKINNNSVLDAVIGGLGDGWESGKLQVDVGEGSNFTLRVAKTMVGEGLYINLNAPTATASILPYNTETFEIPKVVVKVALAELEPDSCATQSLGFRTKGVMIKDLSFDLGAELDDYRYYISMDAGGFYNVTYTKSGSDAYCVWKGGSLQWEEGTEFSDGVIFDTGDMVTFSTADADVILNENISCGYVVIDTGVTVTLSSGGGHQLYAAQELLLNGNLVLKDDVLADGTQLVAGDAGMLTIGGTVTLGNMLDGYHGDLSVVDGGSLSVDALSDALAVTSATEHARLVINGDCHIEKQLKDYKGDLVVTDGALVYIGNVKGANGAASAEVGAKRVIVQKGGAIYTHCGGGSVADSKSFAADWDIMPGSTIGNKDGHIIYSGDMRFNITDPDAATAQYDADGVITYVQIWQKTVQFAGLLSGDGTVQLGAPEWEQDAVYKLTHADNPFAGCYELINGLVPSVNRYNNVVQKSVTLEIGHETAAANATVNLHNTETVGILKLNQDATIKSVSSTDIDNSITAEAPCVLTVTDGSAGFLGKVDTNVTVKFTGGTTKIGAAVNNGTITVAGGTAELGALTNAGALNLSGGEVAFGGTITNNGAITIDGASTGLVDVSLLEAKGALAATGWTIDGTDGFAKYESQSYYLIKGAGTVTGLADTLGGYQVSTDADGSILLYADESYGSTYYANTQSLKVSAEDAAKARAYVVADGLTVESDNTKASITVTSVSIGADSVLTLTGNVDLVLGGNMDNAGTFNFGGTSLRVVSDLGLTGEVNITGDVAVAGAAISVNSGATLELQDGASLVRNVDGAWRIMNATVSVAAGADALWSTTDDIHFNFGAEGAVLRLKEGATLGIAARNFMNWGGSGLIDLEADSTLNISCLNFNVNDIHMAESAVIQLEKSSILNILKSDDQSFAGTVKVPTGSILDFTSTENQTIAGTVNLTGGTLASDKGGTDNRKKNIGRLTGHGTITDYSWNVIWNVAKLDSSGDITWNSTTNHYIPSVLNINGGEFTGTLSVCRAMGYATDSNGYYQTVLQINNGGAGTFSGAVLNLNGNGADAYVQMALHAENVSVGGIEGSRFSHIFAGEATIVGGSGNNSLCKEKSAGTATAVLRITGSGTHSYGGSVGAGISLEKTGAGTQKFLGDLAAFNGNITVSQGVLSLGTGQNITTGRTLSLGAGATLQADVELNGGALVLVAGGTTAASLGNHVLSFGEEKTALKLSLFDTVNSETPITLLSGIATGLELVEGATLGNYFDLTDDDINIINSTGKALLGEGAGLRTDISAERLLGSGLSVDGDKLVLSLLPSALSANPLYWEPSDAAGNGTWSGLSWSDTDCDSGTPAVDPGKLDIDYTAPDPDVFNGQVVFSGDTAATVQVDVDAKVKDMTITQGAYTFKDDGGTLVVTGELGIEQDGKVEFEVSTRVNNITLKGEDSSLSTSADLVVDGKLIATAGGSVINNGSVVTFVEAELGSVSLLGSGGYELNNAELHATITNTDTVITVTGTQTLYKADLVAAGAVDAATESKTYTDITGVTPADGSGNGYLSTTFTAKLFTDAAKVTADSATWKLSDGSALTGVKKADGTFLFITQHHGNEYYINSDIVTYSNTVFADTETRKTTALVLNGGNLSLSTDLADTAGAGFIRADKTGSIEIGDGASLKHSSLASGGEKITITGNSGATYVLDTGRMILPDNVQGFTDAVNWHGTVQLGAEPDYTASGFDSNISGLGNATSVVATQNLSVQRLQGGDVGTVAVNGKAAFNGGASSVKKLVVGDTLTIGSNTTSSLTATDLSAKHVSLLNGSTLTADTMSLDGVLSIGSNSSVKVNQTLTLGEYACLEFEQLDDTPDVSVQSLTANRVNLTIDQQLMQDAANACTDMTQPLATLLKVESGSDAVVVLNENQPNVLAVAANKYDYTLAWDGSGTLLQLIAVANESYVQEQLGDTSANGSAGVALLEDGFLNLNPQVKNPDGDLAAILNAVDAGLVTDEQAAAVAGSSTTALGMAFAGDVERQLRAIRNRTTTMGVNPCVVNEGMPYFNAWINAEGNRGELDKDGTMPGYTLDSWGGTVGFDVDVNPGLTLGMAVTAMYGDLTTDGPDMLEGDMDTYYVSAFARYTKRAWSHTFVATVGKMDTTYERTVSHAGGSYMAEGDTDGTAFGLMYEVARSYTLDSDGNVGGQLVANVAYRHTTVSGYEETGRDAALKVDDQTLDTITFGVGGRMQAVVGENLFNRSSVFEARALAKFDVGDRSSEADVAFLGGSRSATVESAELGAFGVELGAGLSIPVGNVNDGTIFFDVSAELRSGYTNVNGTVGYRINF